MKKLLCLLVSCLFMVGMTACSSDESREYTQHEPGVYKGTQDPLLAKNNHQELNNRLEMGQTDR